MGSLNLSKRVAGLGSSALQEKRVCTRCPASSMAEHSYFVDSKSFTTITCSTCTPQLPKANRPFDL